MGAARRRVSLTPVWLYLSSLACLSRVPRLYLSSLACLSRVPIPVKVDVSHVLCDAFNHLNIALPHRFVPINVVFHSLFDSSNHQTFCLTYGHILINSIDCSRLATLSFSLLCRGLYAGHLFLVMYMFIGLRFDVK